MDKTVTTMLKELIFGKLTLEAIPYHDPLIMSAVSFMGLVVVGVLGYITVTKNWRYVFFEWVATVDHKKSALCI